MTTRKDRIEFTIIQAERIASDTDEVHRAWSRLIRELSVLVDPSSPQPKFNSLLNAVWIAASNDHT